MKDRSQLHRLWIERLSAERLLMGDLEAISSELSSWLDLLFQATSEDAGAKEELEGLVALHAKDLGFDKRPASAVVMQLFTLYELMTEHDFPAHERALVRELIRISADAQALGRAERIKDEHEQKLRDATPIVRLSNGVLLAFMLGPMSMRLIDALFRRLINEVIAVEPTRLVIDLSGAERDDERFHRTVAAMLEQTCMHEVELLLCGVQHSGTTISGLRAAGADMDRARVVSKLSDVV